MSEVINSNNKESVSESLPVGEDAFLSWEEHREKQKEDGTDKESSLVGAEQADSQTANAEELRDAVLDLAKSVDEYERDGDDDLIEFAGMKLSREAVGTDKVMVTELKKRSKFDVLGKAKDKKAMDKLMEIISDEDCSDEEKEEAMKRLFDPYVANLFLQEAHEDYNFAHHLTHYHRMFEALPLKIQLEEFLGQEHLLTLSTPRDYPRSLLNKIACGVLDSIESETGKEKRTGKDRLGKMIERRMFERNFGHETAIDMVDDNIMQRLYDKAVDFGFGEAKRCLGLLKSEQIIAKLGDIANDPDLRVGDVSNTYLMIENEDMDDNKKAEWREKYEEILPYEMRRIVSIGDAFMTELDLEGAKEYLEKLDEDRELREEIGLDEGEWDDLMHGAQTLYEQVKKAKSISDEQIMAIKKYIKSHFWRFISDGDITLENVVNVDEIIMMVAEQFLEKGESEKAREAICQHVFGIGLRDSLQDLVSLGIIEEEKLKGKGISDRIFVGEDRVSIKELDDIPAELRFMILEMVDLCNCSDEELRDKFEGYKEKGISTDESEKIRQCIEGMIKMTRRKTTEAYSKYMEGTIRDGAVSLGEIPYDDKMIPVLEMRGKKMMLLIHRLGAYVRKDKNNPAQWNDDTYIDGGLGYISTTAIADGLIKLANIDVGELDDPDEVFYAFTKLKGESILAMCERDAHTHVGQLRYKDDVEMSVKTGAQDYFCKDPMELIRRTKKSMKKRPYYAHNEVVLDRYSGDPNKHGGRLQPSYIVAFSDDVSKIGDLPKKHASYFEQEDGSPIPILMIDPKKYR
ncbi:hypothetical protein IKG33_01560 [Candidatus Saccharibacteria bacterium]|nr:hypothetical protein [Candidatus Saccharibacteria bacterium]